MWKSYGRLKADEGSEEADTKIDNSDQCLTKISKRTLAPPPTPHPSCLLGVEGNTCFMHWLLILLCVATNISKCKNNYDIFETSLLVFEFVNLIENCKHLVTIIWYPSYDLNNESVRVQIGLIASYLAISQGARGQGDHILVNWKSKRNGCE